MVKFESGSFVSAFWKILSTALGAIPWWMYVAIGVMIVLHLFMDAMLPPEPGAERRRRRRAEILFPRAGSRY